MVSENLKILLDEFDSEVHTLSEESKEKTEELLKYISNYLRFEYDNYSNLLKDESYINFAKGYIAEGNAKNIREMFSPVLIVKTRDLGIEIKNRFLNLLNVPE